MRILVIGASGLVGSHLLREAQACGHATMGTFRHCPLPSLRMLDLANMADTEDQLDTFNPDWVFHAAGWTWVDGCEDDPDRAMEENCRQPGYLARACRVRGIKLAYVSTTYVFDGRHGPYTETAETAPINVYGRSKLCGEKSVLAETGDTGLILRTICVWGLEKRRKNFAYQAIQHLLARKKMRIPADQFGNPTWAGDIAAWSLQLMENNHAGIWNVASPWPETGRVDWFLGIGESLRAAGLVEGKSDEWFQPELTSQLAQKASRPLQASADVSRLMRMFPRQARHFSAIQDILSDLQPGAAPVRPGEVGQ